MKYDRTIQAHNWFDLNGQITRKLKESPISLDDTEQKPVVDLEYITQGKPDLGVGDWTIISRL